MADLKHPHQTIVILGAGFAGLAAALELERRRQPDDQYNVILVDKNPYHVYHALLYEVATAKELLTDEDRMNIETGVRVQIKVLEHLNMKEHLNVLQGEVTGIDLKKHQLQLRDDAPMDFDYLIMALGSESNDFGIPGLAQHSVSLKELPDALTIHQRLHELYNHGARTKNPVRIIIGGGGIAGVETAGELQNYIRQRCRREQNDQTLLSVTLLEAAPTILPGFPAWVQRATIQRLEHLGVTIKVNHPIVRVEDKIVQLKDGTTMPYDLFVWTGGIKAHHLMEGLGIECAGKQQVCVRPTMQLPADELVYAIGDSAYVVDPATDRAVPQIVAVAVAQGRLAAGNIYRQLHQQPLQPYRPDYGGFVFPVGGRWAISTIGGWKLAGWWGWVFRKGVDLSYYLTILPLRQALRLFWRGERAYLGND